MLFFWHFIIQETILFLNFSRFWCFVNKLCTSQHKLVMNVCVWVSNTGGFNLCEKGMQSSGIDANCKNAKPMVHYSSAWTMSITFGHPHILHQRMFSEISHVHCASYVTQALDMCCTAMPPCTQHTFQWLNFECWQLYKQLFHCVNISQRRKLTFIHKCNKVYPLQRALPL